MVLHNMWGVTTSSKNIKKRNVVGRTIISTLAVGKELKGFSKKASLLHKITSMNIITMKPSKEPIIIKPKKVKRKKRKSRRERRKEAKEKKAKEEAAAQAKLDGETATPTTTPDTTKLTDQKAQQTAKEGVTDTTKTPAKTNP